MPRFWDLFFGVMNARKGWIGAGFVRGGCLFQVGKTRVGGLTRVFTGKFEGPMAPHLLALQYPRVAFVLIRAKQQIPPLPLRLVCTRSGFGRDDDVLGVVVTVKFLGCNS